MVRCRRIAIHIQFFEQEEEYVAHHTNALLQVI